MNILNEILSALKFSFSMLWEIAWALILGFLISAFIQAVVSKKRITKLLPNNSARSISIASLLGAASSSCSYASVAIARSLFKKGANFTSAIAFQFAATNLVIELGIILALLMGWQFTLAEFIGGPLMIIIIAILFRLFLKEKLVNKARVQTENSGMSGHEGHAEMDMSSSDRFTAISHYFSMDWQMLWRDIIIGLLIAGALAAWVPTSFWHSFFFIDSGFWAQIWGPLIGPIVAILSFVCSIGNVPLAAVLWAGGISFGGVISFIFADLLIIPILNIYRKYYGTKMMIFLLITSYAAIVLAGLIVEFLFSSLHLIPETIKAINLTPHITFNYTTVLNIIFITVAIIFFWRYQKTKHANECHECH